MSENTDALFGADEVDNGRIGSTERAVRAALTEAALDERDQGAGEAVAQLGRALDVANNVRRDPYAVAAVARPLLDLLTALRMTPAARQGNDAGQVADFLASLGATEE